MAKTPTRKRAAKAASAETAGEPARTLVYVHGVGNKPEESVLRCQWDHALMGFGLGERSRMAYWVQADRHGPPEPPPAPSRTPSAPARVGAEGSAPGLSRGRWSRTAR